MAVTPQTLSLDVRSLDGLRSRSSADPKGAAREAAKAFESLFMQEMMKSMRASTLATGMLDNEGTKLGTEMLDSQLATSMAGRPGGLSDIIAKQLERQMGMAPGPIPRAAEANPEAAPLQSSQEAPKEVKIPQTAAGAFVYSHTQAAQKVSERTGIPAEFMISQAALETGWGRKEIKHADGSPSFNLFGIKADANWKGPVAEVWTNEYIGGRMQRVKAKFRAYGSFEESFNDYARLITESPRYAGVVENAKNARGFAVGLQKAGYATDPEYANKLSAVINTTLRLQRSMA